MRSSSIKSLFAALSIFTMLVVAVPAAEARPAQRETIGARAQDARESSAIGRALQRLLKRLIGGATSNALPSPPLPGGGSGSGN